MSEMNKIELKKFIIFRLSFALQAIQPNLQLELFNLESAFKGNVVFFAFQKDTFHFSKKTKFGIQSRRSVSASDK